MIDTSGVGTGRGVEYTFQPAPAPPPKKKFGSAVRRPYVLKLRVRVMPPIFYVHATFVAPFFATKFLNLIKKALFYKDKSIRLMFLSFVRNS